MKDWGLGGGCHWGSETTSNRYMACAKRPHPGKTIGPPSRETEFPGLPFFFPWHNRADQEEGRGTKVTNPRIHERARRRIGRVGGPLSGSGREAEAEHSSLLEAICHQMERRR